MTLSTKNSVSLPNALILAAGGSSRMGTPKGLLPLGDSTLIEHHISAMRPYSASITVVLGAAHQLLRARLPTDITTCINSNWATTEQADSLRVGLGAGIRHQRAWLVPVDTPPATEDTLQRLLARGAPAIPVDSRGRSGHPALLGHVQLARLREQAPSGGVRSLLESASEVPVADPLVAMNFNTPDDWAAYLDARKLAQGAAR